MANINDKVLDEIRGIVKDEISKLATKEDLEGLRKETRESYEGLRKDMESMRIQMREHEIRYEAPSEKGSTPYISLSGRSIVGFDVIPKNYD